MTEQERITRTEEAHGYGMKVGGPRPYLAYLFSLLKNTIERECREDYHKPVKVVIITESEYRKLKKRK